MYVKSKIHQRKKIFEIFVFNTKCFIFNENNYKTIISDKKKSLKKALIKYKMLYRNPFKLIRFPFKYNKTQFFSTTNNSNQDNSSQSGPVSPNPEINKILKELSSDLNSKVPFIHKFNYNFEENKKYTKNVKKALVSAAEKAKLQSQNVVPRRKRKVYDRPLHDLNLEKYSAWRVFEKSQPKFADDIHNLATKLVVSPALFAKVVLLN